MVKREGVLEHYSDVYPNLPRIRPDAMKRSGEPGRELSGNP